MKVHGTRHLNAPRAAVFEAICDPRVLLAIIPGCESLERVSPTEYHGRINLRLPGIVGGYRTEVRLVDIRPPVASGLEGRLEGMLGTISGRAEFVLQATPSGTDIEYKGTGMITGPLARLDSRFTERLVESLIGQGLTALDARLTMGATE